MRLSLVRVGKVPSYLGQSELDSLLVRDSKHFCVICLMHEEPVVQKQRLTMKDTSSSLLAHVNAFD